MDRLHELKKESHTAKCMGSIQFGLCILILRGAGISNSEAIVIMHYLQ